MLVERRGVGVEQRDDERLLAREVPVEGALADAGFGGNVVDGEVAQALAGRAAPCGAEDVPAALLALGCGDLGQRALLVLAEKPTGRFL